MGFLGSPLPLGTLLVCVPDRLVLGGVLGLSASRPSSFPEILAGALRRLGTRARTPAPAVRRTNPSAEVLAVALRGSAGKSKTATMATSGPRFSTRERPRASLPHMVGGALPEPQPEAAGAASTWKARCHAACSLLRRRTPESSILNTQYSSAAQYR